MNEKSLVKSYINLKNISFQPSFSLFLSDFLKPNISSTENKIFLSMVFCSLMPIDRMTQFLRILAHITLTSIYCFLDIWCKHNNRTVNGGTPSLIFSSRNDLKSDFFSDQNKIKWLKSSDQKSFQWTKHKNLARCLYWLFLKLAPEDIWYVL